MSDVGAVSSLLEKVFSWVVGEDGLAEWKHRQVMDHRDKTAQEMLKHARTTEDWAALRAYVAESERLSKRP